MGRDYIYYTYIATNRNNKVLYTGVTKSLIKRAGEHKNKFFNDSFTAKYNVNKIVYCEIYEDIKLAIKREKQIKNLLRRKKLELINNMNPRWEDLVEKIWNCEFDDL